jgi:hypothetical protein
MYTVIERQNAYTIKTMKNYGKCAEHWKRFEVKGLE